MDLQHLSRARIVLLIATLFIVTGGLSIVLLKNYRAFSIWREKLIARVYARYLEKSHRRPV